MQEDGLNVQKDKDFDQPFLSAEKITIDQRIWPKELKEKFSRRSIKGAPECKSLGKVFLNQILVEIPKNLKMLPIVLLPNNLRKLIKSFL